MQEMYLAVEFQKNKTRPFTFEDLLSNNNISKKIIGLFRKKEDAEKAAE